MRRLTFTSGSTKGAVYDLSGRQVTIGRADENLVVVDDNDVSRLHALLVQEGDEYQLRDLGSINGTRVNGKPVSQALLKVGDIIEFGLVAATYEPAPRDAGDTSAVKSSGTYSELAATRVRSSEVREELESLQQLNHELNQQLLGAREELVRSRVPQTESESDTVARLKTELAASQQDVQRARESLSRIEELSKKNDQLTAQLATKDREMEAVQKAADERLERELKHVNQELTAARQQMDQIRQQAEERLQEEQHERRQLQVQLTQANGDRERLGAELEETRGRLIETQGALEAVRHELDSVKTGSVDVDRLIQDRNRLETELKSLKQQGGPPKQPRAAERGAELEQLRAALSQARAEVEIQAKKETAKIIVTPQPGDGRLKKVQAELEKTRANLRDARQVAQRMDILTRENEALTQQLTATQRQIAALRDDLPADTAPEIERLKKELASARTELTSLATAAQSGRSRGPRQQIPVAGSARRQPSAAPVPALPAVSSPDPELMPDSNPSRIQKVVVGVVVLAAVGFMFWRTFSPETDQSGELDSQKPVVESRLIVDELQGDQRPAGPATPTADSPQGRDDESPAARAAAAAMRQFEETAAGLPVLSVDESATGLDMGQSSSTSPSELDQQPREFRDPHGRFRCERPPDWRLIEDHGSSESQIRLVSGPDTIRVVVQGDDWPELKPDDEKQLEETMILQFRRRHPTASWFKENIHWRIVGETTGLQLDLTTEEGARQGWTRLIAHRSHGRNCLLELSVSNAAQRAVLELIFESFLLNFEVLPPATIAE